MSAPKFEIVKTSMGVTSIRNNEVNEIMHNPVGPWVEANSLYIEQSGLKERLSQASTDPLILFDVGLGAAANALAALHAARGREAALRPLHMVSFERDLELLEFALAHAASFEHFQGFEEALLQILQTGRWKEPGIEWELRHGDFLDLIEAEQARPHVVFYDPYSPKMNTEMWTLSCFKKLHKLSRPPHEGATSLYTYSRATPIRAALLAAGFFVGAGHTTGLKDETTEASTDLGSLQNPFGLRWLERWHRSHRPFPFDVLSTEHQAEMKKVIVEHRQLAPFNAP